MPDLLQILSLYLQILLNVSLLLQCRYLRVICRIKSALDSIAVEYVEFSEDDHSGCRFFCCFVCKFAIWEGEHLISLTKHVWNESDQIVVLMLVDIILWAGAAIHKHILLPGVTMKITIEQDRLIILGARLRQLL
jgi:hypothetical protein